MPGFGANPPGTARKNARSIWDTIHICRPRAGGVCNRRFTRVEMEERIRRGVEAALTPEGEDRDAALRDLKAPARKIWLPAGNGASDPRHLVFRVDAFLSENAAIGSQITPDEWRDASGLEAEAMPDPEEAAEQNTLVAEQAEDGLIKPDSATGRLPKQAPQTFH